MFPFPIPSPRAGNGMDKEPFRQENPDISENYLNRRNTYIRKS